MVKIAALPSQSIIDGMRGVLDFYEDLGLFVVRSWPRNKAGPQTEPAIAAQPIFARSARLKALFSATIETAARRYTLGGSGTWQDAMTRAYYGKDPPSDLAL